MQRLGKYLLAKNIHAWIAVLICMLLPLGVGPLLAFIILGFVTFNKGWKEGLFILAWIVLPAIAYHIAGNLQAYRYDGLFIISVIVWALACLFNKTKSWRVVFEVAALIGVLIVVVVHLIVPDIATYWVEAFKQDQAVINVVKAFNVSMGQITEKVKHLAPWLTGLATVTAFFIMSALLIFARWWDLHVRQAIGGIRGEFIHIRASYYASVILLAASILLIWQNAWIVDIYPVLLLPFIFAGLSFIHYVIAQQGKFVFVLVLVYILWMINPITYYMTGLLVFIGWLDCWINFRVRMQHLIKKT